MPNKTYRFWVCLLYIIRTLCLSTKKNCAAYFFNSLLHTNTLTGVLYILKCVYFFPQIELAGQQLVTRIRINQLVGDQSWKPGVPPAHRRLGDVTAAETVASRWKTTVGRPLNGADTMLKKLLAKRP